MAALFLLQVHTCVFGGHGTASYSGSVNIILTGPKAWASRGCAEDRAVNTAAAATAFPMPA